MKEEKELKARKTNLKALVEGAEARLAVGHIIYFCKS